MTFAHGFVLHCVILVFKNQKPKKQRTPLIALKVKNIYNFYKKTIPSKSSMLYKENRIPVHFAHKTAQTKYIRHIYQ